MKANELRIGNWVNCNIDGCNKISKGMQQLDSTGLMYLFDVDDDWHRIEPIPLTEEWLIKFGGVPDVKNKGWDFKINDNASNTLWVKLNGEAWVGDNDDFYYAVKTKCEHVHQLQNLFYALCQTELTIKE